MVTSAFQWHDVKTGQWVAGKDSFVSKDSRVPVVNMLSRIRGFGELNR